MVRDVTLPVVNPDPVRATLVAILQQLNQAESAHESRAEQALELLEIEDRLIDFWAVRQRGIRVPLALGLLLRNGLVSAEMAPAYSWQRQRSTGARYQITTEGKRFLVEALARSDRIP